MLDLPETSYQTAVQIRSSKIQSPQPKTGPSTLTTGSAVVSLTSRRASLTCLARYLIAEILIILLSHLVSAQDFRLILISFRKISHLWVEAEKGLNNFIKYPMWPKTSVEGFSWHQLQPELMFGDHIGQKKLECCVYQKQHCLNTFIFALHVRHLS